MTAASDELATVDNDPIAKNGDVILPYAKAEAAHDKAAVALRADCAAAGTSLR